MTKKHVHKWKFVQYSVWGGFTPEVEEVSKCRCGKLRLKEYSNVILEGADD